MRNDEILPKQSYSLARKNATLKPTDDDTTTNNKATKSKASKKKQKHSDPSELIPIDDKVSKKKSNDKENGAHNVDLLGHAEFNVSSETSNSPKAKKEKKDKKEKKERKDKKTMKKLSADNAKSGYEEALGISTPSKEIVTS